MFMLISYHFSSFLFLYKQIALGFALFYAKTCKEYVQFMQFNLMSSPLRNRMRSPGFRPALSAGLPEEQRRNDRQFTYMEFLLKSIICFILTRDHGVNPHWSMASESEAKTHVALANSHCPKEANLSFS